MRDRILGATLAGAANILGIPPLLPGGVAAAGVHPQGPTDRVPGVGEIKSIVGIRRSGQAPCRHARALSAEGCGCRGPVTICRHIESFKRLKINEGGTEGG